MTRTDGTGGTGGGHPLRVILRMEVYPDMAADFEKVWLSVGEAIAREPANLGQTLVRSTEEPGLYYVLTDWSHESGFRAFETSHRHLLHRQKLKPYRRGGDMAVTEVVHRLEPESSEPQAG
ncbi:antibiotic biosynthesis monooxygenase [Streptomyces sp. SID5785]|uniref:antibiotic biosynthesis monooxygenase family protein n=1 Tax=Streptomyces sp. SID5785 TaxID=2690309 RepID=UPI0013616D67|nr:antibiotic biosynthesis monooxygenase family protein [Streptomyces sp. SID5785]MZD07781.1 antibiotic biosynthesis monooxygenase [Streptomyces sp. SID5785]